MRVDFEWLFLAHTVAFRANLFTSQIVSTVADIAYPTTATDHSRLKVETAQVAWFGILVVDVMAG